MKNKWLIAVLWSLVFLLTLAAFSEEAHDIAIFYEQRFDQSVVELVKEHATTRTYVFFGFITTFGDEQLIGLFYLILFALLYFYLRRKADAITVLLIGFTSYAWVYGLKKYFSRLRPEMAFTDSYSFPSGHASAAVIFYSVLVYIIWQIPIKRKWKWFATVFFSMLALCVSISRIVLHRHYATDVLAGMAMGIAWVLFAFWLQHLLFKKQVAESSQDSIKNNT